MGGIKGRASWEGTLRPQIAVCMFPFNLLFLPYNAHTLNNRMLTLQYRMHADICGWASEAMYRGRLTCVRSEL